jgi:hypothetical protein
VKNVMKVLLALCVAAALSFTGGAVSTASAAQTVSHTSVAKAGSCTKQKNKVHKAKQKAKKANKQVKKAKKAKKKAHNAKQKKAKNKKLAKAKKHAKKAKKQLKKAKKALKKCKKAHSGDNGGDESPLQPACDAIPQLQPLCDATADTPLPAPSGGNPEDSPLWPLCQQDPTGSLMPLCEATATPPGNGQDSPLQPICDADPTGSLQPLCDATAGGAPDPGTILDPICAQLPIPVLCDGSLPLPVRARAA